MTEGSATAATIRVLLVDDQELVRYGLRLVLEAQPDIEVVGEAPTVRRLCARPDGSPPTWYSWTSACPAWAASRPPPT